MAETRPFRELPYEGQLRVGGSIDDLKRRFSGTFDDETIEHFAVDSFDRLAATAQIKTYLSVLVERFARERLETMMRIDGAESGIPGVLFLCVHNAGRSQMAAGWLRTLAGDRITVYTGGSEPGAALNPVVVEAMTEVGIDITHEFPKPWTDEVARAVDAVVAMDCGDVCPIYPGKRYVEWDLEDPEGKRLEAVRIIRDEIRSLVETLMVELGVGSRIA
jgi:protein-tyrosine-phosphatase